jgi:hypothetical protein
VWKSRTQPTPEAFDTRIDTTTSSAYGAIRKSRFIDYSAVYSLESVAMSQNLVLRTRGNIRHFLVRWRRLRHIVEVARGFPSADTLQTRGKHLSEKAEAKDRSRRDRCRGFQNFRSFDEVVFRATPLPMEPLSYVSVLCTHGEM